MNKLISPLLTVFAFVLLFQDPAVAQEQKLLTLEEAIRIGLENNYNIRIAENNKEIMSNNYGYAKYSFLPRVGASANKNFDLANIEQGRNINGTDTTIIVNNARGNQFSGSVDLQLTIFDGLGMFISYERLAEIRKAGNFDLEATIEGSVAEISKAYFQIVLEKEKVKVLKNTLELSEKRLEIAKAIFEVGRSSKLEYLAAQVDRNADVSALIDQEEQYFNSKVNLNTIIGRKVNVNFEVSNNIHTNKDLEIDGLEASLVENNPNLEVARINRNVTELEMRNIKAERYPEINLNAGYRYTNSEPVASFASYNISSGFYYGLSASFNILNGFDINRRIQNSKISMETNDILYQQLLTELRGDLSTYYLSYQNALKLLELESDNLEIAKESEEIAYERYKLGNANFLELREAQRNEVEAESRLLDASYNTKIAEIELLRLSGRLLDRKNSE